MLKLIHVCHSFQSGGITTFVKSLVELNKSFSSIHDILLINGGRDHLNLTGICKVYNINYDQNGFRIALKKLLSILSLYNGVLIHAAHPVVVLGLFFRPKKVLIFQHGMTVSQGSFLKKRLKRIWYSVVPLILRAKVICSTNFAKKKLKDKGIYLPDSMIKVIPFGIQFSPVKKIEKKGTSIGKITIGLAGRLVAQKRFDIVIKSFANYEGERKFILKIGGEGPEENKLKALAKRIDRHNIEIIFEGHVTDMDSFYASLDLFILPSEGESFGLVVLEALLHGVPVAVFSDVGGALSLVENKRNGFILQNAKNLERLWSYLSKNPNLLYEMQDYIRHMDLSNYHIANTRKNIEEITQNNVG